MQDGVDIRGKTVAFAVNKYCQSDRPKFLMTIYRRLQKASSNVTCPALPSPVTAPPALLSLSLQGLVKNLVVVA